MKKLLYDLRSSQPSIDSKYHGGGEYGKIILNKFISDYHNRNILVSVIYDNDRYIDPWIVDCINKNNLEVFFIRNNEMIASRLDVSSFDIYYVPIADNMMEKLDGVVQVCTMHDLRDYEEPVDRYSYLYYDSTLDVIKQIGKYIFTVYLKKRNLLRYNKILCMCDKYITVSQYTKYAIGASIINNHEKKCDVFYTPSKCYFGIKVIDDFTEENYILLISTNRWIKNVYRALKAIERLYDKGLIENKTVLVGGISNRIYKKLKHKDKYVFLNYLEPMELEYVYSKCGIFVYPTLNEGFGMPPLEAMKYGKTCIVSELCSLPELYEESVYYINPYKIDDIMKNIAKALSNSIDTTAIKERYNWITNKQQRDLENVCEFIIGD